MIGWSFVTGGDDALPDSVRITEIPTSYRVVYEVEAASGPDAPDTVTTEVLQVERPFRSLVMTRAGRPPGGPVIGGRISDLNRLLQYVDGRWTELQVPPAPAASDIRLDRVLDALVESDDVERLGVVRRIAGRACQVHLFGGPITTGELAPVSVRGEDRAEVCVDEAGLVLSEVWSRDDEVLRRRTAVDVEIDPDFDDETFVVEESELVSATDGGGSARRATDDSRFGERTWELPEPPDGFEHEGRWVIVRPRLNVAVDPFADPGDDRIAGIATVWSRGPDALVVEQGASRDGTRPFEPHPRGEEVDLGALDVGEVVTDGRGTEVRVSYVDGSYVRVWSTLPRAEVLALARSLEAGPGGEPRFVPSD